MVEPSESKAKRVMVIVAHPDDADFMAAGTLAKWARQGSEIAYVLCTSGDKGSSDPDVRPADLASTREREQTAAAAVVGSNDVVFLRYPDGELQNTLELRRDLVREIRRFRPDVLLCQDPTNRFSDGYVNHPDHRAAGDAALDAVYPSARDYHAYPDLIAEGFMPHKTLEVYLGGAATNSTVWVDVSDTIDVKVAALREHASQVGADDPERLATLESRIKERAADLGAPHALPYAEGFRYIHLR